MWAWIWTAVYIGYVKFFRIKLLVSSAEDISKELDGMEKEANSIREEALRISWNMRGGVSYVQALQLSYDERSTINKIIKDNLETTKKTGLPYF